MSTSGRVKELILIPAFNEAERLPHVLAGVGRAAPGAEIVVVDDGSEDDTAAVAARNGATVLRLPVNLGYGGALQTGYRYAQARAFDVLVQMDGDGQHDPESIPALCRELVARRLDLAIGSRFLGDRPTYEIGVTRRLGMWFLRRMTGMILQRPISDPTSGFQALTPALVDFYAEWDGFPVDFPDADVLVWIARCGFRIGEVPVVMHARGGGASMHDGLRPLLYGLKMGIALPLWGMVPVGSAAKDRLRERRVETRPAE